MFHRKPGEPHSPGKKPFSVALDRHHRLLVLPASFTAGGAAVGNTTVRHFQSILGKKSLRKSLAVLQENLYDLSSKLKQ